MKKMLAGLAVGVWLGASISGFAVLIAYDGFDYTVGETIAGKNGGVGWGGPWLSGGNFVYGTNVAGSLSYTDSFGNTLITSGNSLLVGNWTLSAAATPSRTLGFFADTWGTGNPSNHLAGGTYWIAFLAQRVGPTKTDVPPIWERQANLSLFANAPTNNQGQERLDIGRPNIHTVNPTPYDTWGVWHANGFNPPGTGAAASFRASNYPLSNTLGATLVVLRIDTDRVISTAYPGGDKAYVWFNPANLLAEPDISTADLVIDGEVELSNVNQIRFHCNGWYQTYTNAMLLVDELRIGTTFADVVPVPEPASVALVAAFVGAGVLAARLRNRKQN